MDIQTAIIEAHKETGWTAERLAEAVGVSKQAVDKWLHRRSKPSADSLLVLLRVLPGLEERLGVKVIRP